MIKTVVHKEISSVRVPGSKSYAQRIILAAAMSDSPVLIKNAGSCEDVKHILEVAKAFGAKIDKLPEGNLMCTPNRSDHAQDLHLNCGESGLGTRLSAALAAVLSDVSLVNGAGSLLQRPMSDFESILPQIGKTVELKNQRLPLLMSGTARGGDIVLDGSSGSQYLSGLLMALPLLKEDSVIRVSDLKSVPYIDITLQVLNDFGINIEHEQYQNFIVSGGQSYKAPAEITVEGDWSGASCWLAYGAIRGNFTILGLAKDSLQADKAMLDALQLCGCNYSWMGNELVLTSVQLNPFEFDATNCPDLFPALVVLAAGCKGTSYIQGAKRLVHKESDRASALVDIFSRLGLELSVVGDVMSITGAGKLVGGKVSSHNDHRMAIAAAVASILADGPITIDQAESVSKSYPEFWDEWG